MDSNFEGTNMEQWQEIENSPFEEMDELPVPAADDEEAEDNMMQMDDDVEKTAIETATEYPAENSADEEAAKKKAEEQEEERKRAEHEASEAKRKAEKAKAEEDKKSLENQSLTIKAKGSQSKLFGAITSKEIAEALEKQSGLSIDKKKISVANIKTYGAYTAEVKLYPEIAAKVTVNIVPEE